MKNPNEIPDGFEAHPEFQQCCVTETHADRSGKTPINRPDGDGWWPQALQCFDRQSMGQFPGTTVSERVYVVQWARVLTKVKP